MTSSLRVFCAFALASLVHFNAAANDWRITVVDQAGKPLDDAVVELVSLDAGSEADAAVMQQTSIKQQGLNFVPFVSAVQVGTEIDFPNLDRTRHHVYSFSPAKVFEIQLYHDRPEQPILFDQAGIVALGCNIHDYMEAYVFISESNLVGVTDPTGQFHFSQLNPGRYQLRLWHPFQLDDMPSIEMTLDDSSNEATFSLKVQHRPKQPTPQRGFGS
ncbi:carboxypeptidase regulatory-like domain-containing protein [Alkalimonas sp.]|uniref:carboxypeptidase regulatory-like domain-containing protein n=1 Tax=Alkalimonas sp. TaxID=1872453 RepID=UPI00263A9576|nr:carboxypeptidase regulatory-like domain-containing protein [Alkalimonas sp.]MCC5825565.1 methylamine utilization protein [Alkalimonas sp.]